MISPGTFFILQFAADSVEGMNRQLHQNEIIYALKTMQIKNMAFKVGKQREEGHSTRQL